VFVNNASKPSLEVDKLSNSTKGGLALWVGNNSGGSFANLSITPAAAGSASARIQKYHTEIILQLESTQMLGMQKFITKYMARENLWCYCMVGFTALLVNSKI
jgi:hypothetical protein